MADLITLKAQAYDVLVEIEQHQRAIQALQKEVVRLNGEIAKARELEGKLEAKSEPSE